MPEQRVPPFELPYLLSGVYCSGALERLEADAVVDKFPPDLLHKIYEGSGLFGSGYTITQEDVDGLSDEAWAYLQTLPLT